jgi:hypothetical protein
LHGEAAAQPWQFVAESDSLCRARTVLRAAGLELERTLSLLPAEPVLRCRETLRNTRPSARDFHWVQHASFGTPMLSPAGFSVAASVTQGRTWPYGYEGHAALADNTSFIWPLAPAASFGSPASTMVDLRRSFSVPGTGYVVALQQDPAREFGFVAALNSSLGLAVGYVFQCADFPWLTLWEENAARSYSPWNEQTQVRGLEFGSTPWPLSREESAGCASLFDRPCARHLGSNATTQACWALFVAQIPSDWRELSDVLVDSDQIVLRESQRSSMALPALGIASFLQGDAR